VTVQTRRARRGLKERVFGNPVVLKELRGRMRGPRAFMVLTVYLGMTSGFALLLYILQVESLSSASTPTGGEVGRTLFLGVVGVELFLVTYIGPAFTANAISGERERRTYELLRTTLLSSRALVVGKMTSALSYIVLLLFATVPLQAIAFLFGGVTPEELGIAMVLLLVTALHFGSVGMYCSSVMQRTLPASVMTYGYALVITVGFPLVTGLVLPVILSLGGSVDSTAFQTILLYVSGVIISINPIATAIVTENLIVERNVIAFFQQPLSTGAQAPAISPWIPYTIFSLIISLVLVWLSVRRVRQVADE
jgi:ABC-type transport system involved in multi-copper enzyme maturation permease subunit